MDKNLLKSQIALHGETAADLAKVLGITPTTLSRKINEVDKGGFNQNEITAIKLHYDLTPEIVDAIFFTIEVS